MWSWRVSVTQLCLTLWDPMDCSPPGSSEYGILQARILESVVIPFFRGSTWPTDRSRVSCTAGGFSTLWDKGIQRLRGCLWCGPHPHLPQLAHYKVLPISLCRTLFWLNFLTFISYNPHWFHFSNPQIFSLPFKYHALYTIHSVMCIHILYEDKKCIWQIKKSRPSEHWPPNQQVTIT